MPRRKSKQDSLKPFINQHTWKALEQRSQANLKYILVKINFSKGTIDYAKTDSNERNPLTHS